MKNTMWENTSKPKENQQNQKHRPIVGDRIYLSHPETYKNPYQDPRIVFRNLKPASEVELDDDEPSKDTQVYKERKIKASSNITDSCTQTSKTILELAKLDAEGLSPDSLTQSPRNPQAPNQNHKINLKEVESKLQMCPTNSEHTIIDSSYKQPSNPVNFMRKNNIMHYMDGSDQSRMIPVEEINIYPKKSLTTTFLEKKQLEDPSTKCDCRSRFLQQTSPLRNLNYKNYDPFRSHSYVESYDPNFILGDVYPEKLSASRFTVKHVKQIKNEEQPKFLWPPNESVKVEKLYENSDNDTSDDDYSSPHTRKNSKTRPAGAFMAPTLASELKNQQPTVQNIQNLISPTRRGKSLSPPRNPSPASNLVKRFNHEKIPYIDRSSSHLEVHEPVMHKTRMSFRQRNKPQTTMVPQLATRPKFDEDLLKIDLQSLEIRTSEETMGDSVNPSCSSASFDNIISITIARIRNRDWAIALKGLAEMTELCRIMDNDMLYPHMTAVNQRLLELLRSSRSHVCRTACQAAGHFFESMKDTRRPEFDDIVENLLCKTADANKFIRKDANLSLDCMVTHIPIFHSVRSLCLKGPIHKNALVRTATVRLLVCAVVITGPDIVLHLQCHEHTRRRIITHMAKFLQDKHQETRKYGERLYKVLCKESMFETSLKKFLEKNEITRMKSALKNRK